MERAPSSSRCVASTRLKPDERPAQSHMMSDIGRSTGRWIRPGVATVVTTHGWEPRLAQQIRTSGLVRLLQRCSTYEQVLGVRPDVVVVGSESALATPAVVRSWRLAGIVVIGVLDPTDPTSANRMAEADGLFRPEDPAMLPFLATVTTREPEDRPHIFNVTGPRGTPGRTEVALALAWAVAGKSDGCDLVDLDLEAPCLGLRLGVPPFETPGTVPVGPVRLTGFPPGQSSLGESLRARILASLEGPMVIDGGPGGRPHGTPVVVATTDDIGLVRLVRLLKRWTGPDPLLVVNRSTQPDADRELVTAATGFEPAVVIPAGSKPTGPAPIPTVQAAMERWVEEMSVEPGRLSA